MTQRLLFKTNEEWLQNRKMIGGSDAAALVGMSPWKSNVDLWREKSGRVKANDISDKPYVQFGHDAEPHLRALFALDHPQYEVHYYPNSMWVNSLYPYAHASLDGELIEKETGRRGILEVKTSDILQSMQKEKWNNRVPDSYYCQVLWYLLVTEFDFVILKARLRSDWPDGIRVQIKHYMIERNEVEEDIEELRKAGEKFWKAVQEDKEPHLILPPI